MLFSREGSRVKTAYDGVELAGTLLDTYDFSLSGTGPLATYTLGGRVVPESGDAGLHLVATLSMLTDDGGLAHRLTDPSHGHPRVYWAQVERVPSDESMKALRSGLQLSDGKTRSCKARVLEAEPELPPRNPPIRFRLNVPTAWIELTMTEGRNRQVRRMCAAIGHPCVRLVRAAIGSVKLGGLEPGKWRWVDRRELAPKPR